MLFDPGDIYVDLQNHRDMTKGYWQLVISKMQYAIDNRGTVGQGMYIRYDTAKETRRSHEEQPEKDQLPETPPCVYPSRRVSLRYRGIL